MSDILEEYGFVILELVAAAIVLGLFFLTSEDGNIILEWLRNYAASLGG
jgi:hypothetical protein